MDDESLTDRVALKPAEEQPAPHLGCEAELRKDNRCFGQDNEVAGMH